MSYAERDDCVAECRVLSRMHNPYIVRFYDSFLHDDNLYIVMEYAQGGSLQSLIDRATREGKVRGQA